MDLHGCFRITLPVQVRLLRSFSLSAIWSLHTVFFFLIQVKACSLHGPAWSSQINFLESSSKLPGRKQSPTGKAYPEWAIPICWPDNSSAFQPPWPSCAGKCSGRIGLLEPFFHIPSSAVQDHLRSVQSSDAVMLECIWLFMGSIITVATALSWGNCCFSGLRVLLTAGTAWWWKWRWAGGCHWNHKGEVVASHEFSSVDCCL